LKFGLCRCANKLMKKMIQIQDMGASRVTHEHDRWALWAMDPVTSIK